MPQKTLPLPNLSTQALNVKETTAERKNIALEWIFEYIPFGGLGVSSSS
jgi:hypothetical protein